MISERHWHDLAKCFCGVVAIPSRSPDCPDAGREYHADNGEGVIPNVRAFFSDQDIGRAIGQSQQRCQTCCCDARSFDVQLKTLQQGVALSGVCALGASKMTEIMPFAHEFGHRQLHGRPGGRSYNQNGCYPKPRVRSSQVEPLSRRWNNGCKPHSGFLLEALLVQTEPHNITYHRGLSGLQSQILDLSPDRIVFLILLFQAWCKRIVKNALSD